MFFFRPRTHEPIGQSVPPPPLRSSPLRNLRPRSNLSRPGARPIRTPPPLRRSRRRRPPQWSPFEFAFCIFFRGSISPLLDSSASSSIFFNFLPRARRWLLASGSQLKLPKWLSISACGRSLFFGPGSGATDGGGVQGAGLPRGGGGRR